MNKRILFIPVSSPEGMGEYMRSRIIADALYNADPTIEIAFILNRNAPYFEQCPYHSFSLESTPTLCTRKVNQVLRNFKPHVVVFDAAGRASQLREAKRQGAKTIFISQHKRKRSKGLSWKRFPYVDLHWVAQPEFALPSLSWLDRFKIEVLGAAAPSYLNTLFTLPDVRFEQEQLKEFGLHAGGYFLVSSGSGGHQLDSSGLFAADIFLKAALSAAEPLGLKPFIVMGSNYPKDLPKIDGAKATIVRELSNAKFISLLKNSRIALLSGGGTLLQAVSMGVPVVSVAVAKDQNHRVKVFSDLGFIIESSVEPDALKKALLRVGELQAVEGNGSFLSNGLDSAVSEILKILR